MAIARILSLSLSEKERELKEREREREIKEMGKERDQSRSLMWAKEVQGGGGLFSVPEFR